MDEELGNVGDNRAKEYCWLSATNTDTQANSQCIPGETIATEPNKWHHSSLTIQD